MLTKEQRDSIMKLYGEDINISEIARKVGVSRHSVYRVIHRDIEQDPDVHALKKKLRKAKLQKSIREVEKPIVTERKLNWLEDRFEYAVDSLASMVLTLFVESPELKSKPKYCPYCKGELEPYKEKETYTYPDFRCSICKKFFRLP